MWNATANRKMPDYWPPRSSRAWQAALEPGRRWFLRRWYGIQEVAIEGLEGFEGQFARGDGLLIAPNHSHDSDPHVMMEFGRRLSRRLHFMAAWQLFSAHHGLDGFILQRLGAFSVDREGCDRRAIQQAVGLLSGGGSLVVFPEGEVYRLNERLTPLLEGVAFMAVSAQRDLEKAGGGRVWIVPAAIQYRYTHDIRPQLEAAMTRLEQRMVWKPPHGITLDARILRFGELLLTLKEKEKLGRSCETDGDLPARINSLIQSLLTRLETAHLSKSPAAETVPLRIKALRRTLLDAWTDEARDAETRRLAGEALDDVHLVLQLYSYPGNYIAEKPSLERMAETVDKFEEDIEGQAQIKGPRRAKLRLGAPIDLSQVGEGRPRVIAAEVTDRLEAAIQTLMAAEA
jgi:1-acyl-sn-glycerol-3-phosphate acyltransferase